MTTLPCVVYIPYQNNVIILLFLGISHSVQFMVTFKPVKSLWATSDNFLIWLTFYDALKKLFLMVSPGLISLKSFEIRNMVAVKIIVKGAER